MEVTILVSEGVHLELSCVRVPPNLNMSVFPMPTKVVKKSDKLRRDFLWKVGRVGSFLELLPNLTQSGEETKNGSLSVKRAYKRELNEQFRRSIGPWKSIWKNLAPTKSDRQQPQIIFNHTSMPSTIEHLSGIPSLPTMTDPVTVSNRP
ncbi:hypothetical protein H5410_058059 [Solanum commersonii]|uniref:Uncharacterized protein n=1 Tax=Solanum commersonii TaxID=4109 RepID=A0A9J5WRJ1_SOLCO|nr:hypothetical protein H5410_058059 [Solanum commersonii]